MPRRGVTATFAILAGITLLTAHLTGAPPASKKKPKAAVAEETKSPDSSASAESPDSADDKAGEKSAENSDEEVATFGSGCFWCGEAVFQQLKGVKSAVSGYSGGHIKNPSYKQVCTGLTGHAEVVQVTFDPKVISYGDLLEVFFKTHDPTSLNRQGRDYGTQYRSVIFYHNEEQQKLAEEFKRDPKKTGASARRIVTEITKFSQFYPAEDYHQDFYDNNPNYDYSGEVIRHKVLKARKLFKDKLK